MSRTGSRTRVRASTSTRTRALVAMSDVDSIRDGPRVDPAGAPAALIVTCGRHDGLLGAFVRVGSRGTESLEMMIGLVERDEPELGVVVDHRARRAADDGAVRVGTTVWFNALVIEALAVEEVGEDGGLHSLVRFLLICGDDGLEVGHGGLLVRMTGDDVAYLCRLWRAIQIDASKDRQTSTYHAAHHTLDRSRVVAKECIRDSDNAVSFASEDGGRHREEERDEGGEAHGS